MNILNFQQPTFLEKIFNLPTIIILLLLTTVLSSFYFFNNENKRKNRVTARLVSKDPTNEFQQLYQLSIANDTISSYQAFDFFPKNLTSIYSDTFDISAAAYAIMNRETKELLYGKNIIASYNIASLTKIMTALLALELVPLDTIFTISPNAVKTGEATMGLSVGERLSSEELIYGAMLPSGNDAAEALAEGVGIYYALKNNWEVDRASGRQWFITEMNRKAQNLGMYDTYFFNPTGLDEETRESSSFSTVLDLLALAAYALENPIFAKIAATRYYQIPYKKDFHNALFLENILQLDGSFPGIKGIKPGNSIFAKETLISYIERDGKRLITVLLDSSFTKDDVLKIYKTIFNVD